MLDCIKRTLSLYLIGGAVLVVLLLTVISARGPGPVRLVISELATICGDSTTRCQIATCLTFYILAFLVLEARQARIQNFQRQLSGYWLFASVLQVLFSFALAFPTAMRSANVLVYLFGIVFGKCIATWARPGSKSNNCWKLRGLL